MPLNADKSTIGVTVTSEFKERIKQVAKSKHWSVSQTVGLFIEAYWELWEEDLGIGKEQKPTPKKPSKQ